MDLKKLITEKGMKLMQDPRFMRVMQDERVLKAMTQAFQMRGKAQESFDQTVEKVAKRLGLVTKSEIRDLKRSMRKLETELKKAQKEVQKARKAAESADDD